MRGDRAIYGLHVATIKRRHGEKVYESHLVRRSFREGKKVRHETVLNVSRLPPAAVEALRRALAGEDSPALHPSQVEVEGSLPHGAARAVLAAATEAKLPGLLERRDSRLRRAALALVCQRVLTPAGDGPGAGAARSSENSGGAPAAAAMRRSTLLEELTLGDLQETDLSRARMWLEGRRETLERSLTERHVSSTGTLLCHLLAARSGHTVLVLSDLQGLPVRQVRLARRVAAGAKLVDALEGLRATCGAGWLVLVAHGVPQSGPLAERLQATSGIGWLSPRDAAGFEELQRSAASRGFVLFHDGVADLRGANGERLVVDRRFTETLPTSHEAPPEITLRSAVPAMVLAPLQVAEAWRVSRELAAREDWEDPAGLLAGYLWRRLLLAWESLRPPLRDRNQVVAETLAELSLHTRNTVSLRGGEPVTVESRLTPAQTRALELAESGPAPVER